MNEKIKELAKQAGSETWSRAPMRAVTGLAFTDENLEKFVELLLANLADELIAVATASKKANPEWANGVNHAAMLAQRMLLDLPEEE